MNLIQVSSSSSGTTEWISPQTSDGSVGRYMIVVEFDSATATVDVEFTIDGGSTVITHDVLNGLTDSKSSDLYAPVSDFRLNVTSYTSGTINLKILQSG